MKLYYSKYYPIYLCVSCKHELTRSQMMYSGGVCPLCGHNDHSTICDVETISVRDVYECKKLLGFIPYKKFIKTER